MYFSLVGKQTIHVRPTTDNNNNDIHLFPPVAYQIIYICMYNHNAPLIEGTNHNLHASSPIHSGKLLMYYISSASLTDASSLLKMCQSIHFKTV